MNVRRTLLALLIIAGSLGSLPASGGTAAQPEITDPAGDANVVDGVAPGTLPPSPASIGWADITKAWFTTDHTTAPAKQGGERGMLKVPQRLRAHIQTAAPIVPVGAGVVYAVDWEVNNCTYRLLAHVPGAFRDSRKALLANRCGPGSYYLDLEPPVVNGSEIQIAIDLGSDADLRLYDGYSLARIRAFTAPYVDWYWDYRYTSDTQGYIDYAPSSGNLGYYEIGSDLAPRFTPGLSFEPGSVTTVAGGSNGDGLPATQASLSNTWGVSVGPDGLVYISDYSHSRLRRVAEDGTMEGYAGFIWGFGGDGGHRLLSLLHGPTGMDWGSDGTLYFADSLNHRVRAIAPDGTIRTVAGNGARRFAGDGGPATKASLAWPQDVAVGSDGDLYIADQENARIRRVDVQTGTISTFAGGAAVGQDNVPATQASVTAFGLAFDAQGDLWVSEIGRVREIDRATNVITTRVSNLDWPRGLTFDVEGRLYIADSEGHVVYRRETDGTVNVFAGGGTDDPGDGGTATAAVLDVVNDVDVDAEGNVYIAERNAIGTFVNGDVGHDRVRVVRPDGTIETLAGTGHDKAASEGPAALSIDFQYVAGLAYDQAGRLYIADSPASGISIPKARKSGGRIWRLDPDGSIRVVAGSGDQGIEDEYQDGPALEVPLSMPRAIDVGPDGRLWIVDAGTRKIRVFDPVARTLTTAAGNLEEFLRGGNVADEEPALDANLYFPRALAVAPNGDVYFTEASYGGCSMSRIRMLRGGVVRFVGGSRGSSAGCGWRGDGAKISDTTRFTEPEGLEFDAAGNLLIADSFNARIRRVDAVTRVIDTIAGDGALEHRDGTIAPLASLTYVSDVESTPEGGFLAAELGLSALGIRNLTTGPRISYVAPNGMVSQVAGNGIFDIARDDAALAASFVDPIAIARAPSGVVAVADYTRVRILTPDEGGFPQPAREVRCLPMSADTAGDARARMTLNTHQTNNPALDLRSHSVSTAGGALTVTMKLEDIELAHILANDHYPTFGAAWVYLFTDGSGQYAKYLAAFGPFNQDDTAGTGGYTFEWGETTGGTFESLTFTRRGAATGAVDTTKETVTVSAPLGSVGLTNGERVIYQVPLTGNPTQYGLGKFSVYADHTPYTNWWRSYTVGKECPGGYA